MSANNKLKQAAVRYYHENQVPQKIEDLLNSMFLNQPEDIFGYMSEHFGQLSKVPVITKVDCCSSLSSLGYESLTAHVYCCVKGITKHVCDLTSFADGQLFKEPMTLKQASVAKASSKQDPKRKASKKEATESRNSSAVEKTIPHFKFSTYLRICEDLLRELEGTGVFVQSDVEEKLRNAVSNIVCNSNDQDVANVNPVSSDESTETKTVASTLTVQDEETLSPSPEQHDDCKTEANMAAFYVSLVYATADTKLRELSLYRSLSMSFNGKTSVQQFSLPSPAVPFFSCSLSTPGKLNMFKEVLILPKLQKDVSMAYLMSFYHHVEESILTKFGAAGHVRNEFGLLTPPYDKPEQVFECLTNVAKTAMDIEFSEYFDVIINVAAHQLYDEDKKKYEICTGGQKTTDDLIALYGQLIESFPVVAIIDGAAVQDENGIHALFTALSHCCYLFAEPDEGSSFEEFSCDSYNGTVLYPQRSSTLTDLMELSESLQGNNMNIMIADKFSGATNGGTFIDLAVWLNSVFVRTPPPMTGAAAWLDRILKIKHELEQDNLLAKRQSYVFNSLPGSPSHEDEGGEQVEES